MVSREQLRRHQVAGLTLLGAVGGPLLLAIAEMWVTYLFWVIAGPALTGGRYPYLPHYSSGWLHHFSTAFASSAVVACLTGPMLGSLTTCAWLQHKPEPRLVGQICIRWAISLLIMLVLWRLLLVRDALWEYRIPMTGSAMLSGPPPLIPQNAGPLVHSLWVSVLDPAMAWSLALWRWGVLLRRQAIKEDEAEYNAA